jgi:ubiquinone/menaquinone biosynthesis C-methylase UbiE
MSSVLRRLLGTPDDLEAMDDGRFVDLAYRLLLGREADAHGRQHFVERLQAGQISRELFLKTLIDSQEFARERLHSDLSTSLHESRGRFVRSLPPSRRIVDIGGSCQGSTKGAMVEAGWPYPFERLTIVDLPSDERHELYQTRAAPEVVRTELGPVEYLYQSMTTLEGIPDRSIDLVYSGQSIEHVTRDETREVYREVLRVLRPGGLFALDTPNARLTRLQQDEFVDPDHDYEYTHAELSGDLEAAGFEIVEAKGLNYAGPITRREEFDATAIARACGVFSAIEDCYVLAYLCRKRT